MAFSLTIWALFCWSSVLSNTTVRAETTVRSEIPRGPKAHSFMSPNFPPAATCDVCPRDTGKWPFSGDSLQNGHLYGKRGTLPGALRAGASWWRMPILCKGLFATRGGHIPMKCAWGEKTQSLWFNSTSPVLSTNCCVGGSTWGSEWKTDVPFNDFPCVMLEKSHVARVGKLGLTNWCAFDPEGYYRNSSRKNLSVTVPVISDKTSICNCILDYPLTVRSTTATATQN